MWQGWRRCFVFHFDCLSFRGVGAALAAAVVVLKAAVTLLDTGVSSWIGVIQRIVTDVAIEIPALRVGGILVAVGIIGTHETAEGGTEVAGAEVVEAGFGVAALAGEVDRALVCAGPGEPVSEGQVGAGGVVELMGVVRYEEASAVRANLVLLVIVGVTFPNGGQMTAAGVDFAAPESHG